jgi:ubiquinone biosynthesis UbiH/UbiF/VisC/COQ6 family hydroxylase
VDLDLIVVGGGPVGASLARAARGLAVALVATERRVPREAPYEGFDARVYALSPGNVRFLDGLGAMPLAQATPVHAMRVHGDDGSRIEFDAYRAGVPALAWIVEDRLLQDALWRGLEAEVGAPEAITVKDRDVVLGLADGRQLSARLIAGADGARSFVREHAGIRCSDKAYGQSAVVANFACERAHANTAYQWFQCGPVLALLPLRASHVSMVWSLPAADAERISALAPEALCREVEAATRGVLGQFSLVTAPRSYPLRRLSARRLVAPRIALVGDAGHVIHPLAGQGLNLGLQDARALAEVLAQRGALLRDPGDLRLLRRYERSRAEPILAMDTMVDGLYTLFGTHNRLAGRLRNAGLNLTDRIPVLKNLLIRQALH